MIFDEKFLQQEIEARWGKHGAHAEVYRMLLAKACRPEALRVLRETDAFCPNCGHNRDKSSVSTIAFLDGRKECQMCGALWREFQAPPPHYGERKKHD